MPLFSRKTLKSTAFISFVYITLSCLAIAAFRRFFPGEEAPLPVMEDGWWKVRALLDIVAFFPALALTAIVLPFGMNKFSVNMRHGSFSKDLFADCFKVPVVAALCLSALYALLFFFALPVAQSMEKNMQLDGEIYATAKERLRSSVEAEDWTVASHFVGIIDRIWSRSPEIWDLREEVDAGIDHMRWSRDGSFAMALPRPDVPRPPASIYNLPGYWNPVDASDALAKSREAYDGGRFFDAHWLATLGSRLARAGSAQQAAATELVDRSWRSMESGRPSAADVESRRLFNLKMSGYRAMLSQDWINAFYIFSEFSAAQPNDPDVANFLALSRERLASSAFFTDQMDIGVGRTITGAVFSMPFALNGGRQGRAVMRLGSFTYLPGVAYAADLEYMLFDGDSRLMLHFTAAYAKFTPRLSEDGRQQVLVMMRALDRNDSAGRWEPGILYIADGVEFHSDAQMLLDVSYGDFLLLSRMRQDISALSVGELLDAVRLSPENGHIPQVFRAEILGRLGSGLFFLPLAITCLAVAWYLRTRRFPKYLFVPLLFVLPLVFNGVVYMIRTVTSIAGISLTLALDFPLGIVAFAGIMALTLVLSMLLLAGQRNR